MSSHFFHISAEAGAGTGKTYSLVQNYLEALLGIDPSQTKKRPDQILALTFTQKAANEMRLRIAKKLNTLMAEDSSFDRDELRRLIRALPNATISTFHSFCADLLRIEAKHLKINEQFQILLPHEEQDLAKNILRSMLIERIAKPDPIIRSLVARFRIGSGPLSLGLIDHLYSCYQKLFEHGLKIENLLANREIFSVDALKKDIASIDEALAHFYTTNPSKKTCEKLDLLARIISKPITLENEADLSRTLIEIKTILKGNFGDTIARQSLILAVNTLVAHAIDHVTAPDEEALALLIADFHESFMARKSALLQLGYSDLLLITRDALAHDLELRKRLKKRYRHILVDEYQDTSPLQEELIAFLAENKESEGRINANERPLSAIDWRQGSSLFVVGDKKQSIYSFRGANTVLFDDVQNKMAATHQSANNYCKKRLSINRRSAASIIKLVNLVARYSLAEQGYDESHALVPAIGEEGCAQMWLSADDAGRDPSSANLYTAAMGIAKLLSDSSDIKAGDITVLVRRMRSGVMLKGILSSLGIAARMIGGEGFFQQPEIVDLLSALKLINDQHHEFAAAVVLRSPLVLLCDQDLMTIHSLFEDGRLSLANAKAAMEQGALKHSGAERLLTFIECLDEIRSSIAKRGLDWAVDRLIEKADLVFSFGLMDQAEQKWANINKLRSMLAQARGNPYAIIEEYYKYIFNNQKEAQAMERTGTSSLLTIMTIHQAKGLEFKVVVVADIESTLTPASSDILCHPSQGLVLRPKGRAIANLAATLGDDDQCQTRFKMASNEIRQAELLESARLLYVALTRACSHLYVVSSRASFLSAKNNGKSLLDLFLRAYAQEKESFLALCAIQEICEQPRRALKEELVIEEGLSQFVWQKTTTHYFASMLNVPENWIAPDFPEIKGHFGAVLDGNLAHHLLAVAGSMLPSFNVGDRDSILRLLDTGLRAFGPYPDFNKAKNTQLACLNTLLFLHKDLKSAQSVCFEQPIFTRPTADFLIEGFADVVLHFDDFIGVIEFKSSLSLINNPKTYLQLLAYAEGLAKNNEKPVKYAAVLIGLSQPIAWLDYDKNSKEALLEVLISPVYSG